MKVYQNSSKFNIHRKKINMAHKKSVSLTIIGDFSTKMHFIVVLFGIFCSIVNGAGEYSLILSIIKIAFMYDTLHF
jgi:hypothetical protein